MGADETLSSSSLARSGLGGGYLGARAALCCRRSRVEHLSYLRVCRRLRPPCTSFLVCMLKVCFTVQLRGRERAQPEMYRALLEKVARLIEDIASPAHAIKEHPSGSSLSQLFQPRGKKKRNPTLPTIDTDAQMRRETSSQSYPTKQEGETVEGRAD